MTTKTSPPLSTRGNNTPRTRVRSDRDCVVLVYEKKHCHGHLLFVNDKINDPDILGKHADCWHWDGIPGMSIKVKCRVKGSTPDWEPETHWTDAVSTNEHDEELGSNGLPNDPKDSPPWEE
ncbi:unnamed protein product [Zymoseptoria tritici ST99CH_3D7]|uniref:Uncharacterized protein n=1 Tax=Zymoseptoria tritici (strain ST99CH_3D7) TaxID=1276538 RepID=A0A1X7S758_ZYMT9|nr:unnamed protein product [Zymoseptoria tritici ST99CH_3D7]